MFGKIAIDSLIATAVVILLHFFVYKPRFDSVFGKDRSLKILDPLRVVIFFVTALFVEQKWSLVGALRKLVFLLALLCFVILAATGLIPKILWGSVSGYWLSIHATASPVFAACMAILAVLWADNNRFDKNYIPFLNKILNRSPKSTIKPLKGELCLKISFWCIMFLMLPAILSAVLSMFPIFGTEGQHTLLWIHRYSTLILTVLAIIYLYLAGFNEMEKNAAR